MKLFQYAVLYHPKKNGQEESTEKDRIIVDLKTILAADEKTAAMLAARDIPEDYTGKLEQVEIALRPF